MIFHLIWFDFFYYLYFRSLFVDRLIIVHSFSFIKSNRDTSKTLKSRKEILIRSCFQLLWRCLISNALFILADMKLIFLQQLVSLFLMRMMMHSTDSTLLSSVCCMSSFFFHVIDGTIGFFLSPSSLWFKLLMIFVVGVPVSFWLLSAPLVGKMFLIFKMFWGFNCVAYPVSTIRIFLVAIGCFFDFGFK